MSDPNKPSSPLTTENVTEVTPDMAEKLASNPGTLLIGPVQEIQGEAKLAVYLDKLMADKALLEKTLDSAVIEEDRTLERREALRYLVLSAMADGINPETLVLTEEYVDKNGAILKLEAKSTDEKGNYKLVTYQIKRDGTVDETNVDVSSWEKDSEYPDSGDVMAKYVAGKWLVFDNSQPKGQKWVAQK